MVTKKAAGNHAQQHHDFCVSHLLQKFVRSFPAALFRTFLQSLLNGAMFLNFELPKRTFSSCDGCRIYQRKLADQDNFIYHSLLTLIPETSSCCLQCHRVQFLLANPVAPWRFKNLLIKKDAIVCAYTTSPGWLKRKSLRPSAVL